jgi:hypothetical protein
LIGAAILFEWCAMSSRVSGGGNRTIAAAGLAIALIPMAMGASAILSGTLFLCSSSLPPRFTP